MKKILVSLIVFLIAMVIAVVLGLANQNSFSLNNPYIVLTLIAFAIQWIAFIPAAIFQTEKFYDLTGSITYLSTAVISLSYYSILNMRSVLIAAMVGIWALRLGTFLFIRIGKDGKDSRFDQIKVDPARFFITWNLQGLWVSLTSCAAWTGLIYSSSNPQLGILGYIGTALWILGFTFEVIADRQKSKFKSDPTNKGKYINVGLWSKSRHPNYFGEIVLWTGIFVMNIEVLVGFSWVSTLSPIFVYLLLTKVSGIPLLTEKAKERWGDDPSWQEYFNKTPALFPKLF